MRPRCARKYLDLNQKTTVLNSYEFLEIDNPGSGYWSGAEGRPQRRGGCAGLQRTCKVEVRQGGFVRTEINQQNGWRRRCMAAGAATPRGATMTVAVLSAVHLAARSVHGLCGLVMLHGCGSDRR